MLQRLPIAAALASPFVFVLAIAAGAFDAKEFAQQMASPDSNVRAAAVKALDPNDKKQRELLFKVLEGETWFIRANAVHALVGASGEALDDLKKALDKDSSQLVREGVAISFGKRNEPDRVADLVAALDDSKAIVRRAVAVALMMVPHRDSVPALVKAWEEEKANEVTYYYREALEKITGEFKGLTPGEWKEWWAAVGDRWEPKKKEKGEAEADAKKAEEEGKKGEEQTTTLRGVELSFQERGSGGPMFVLPEYGMNRAYLEKHLQPLEDVARLFYIDLPESSKFKDLGTVGGTGMAYYPIDKLVDAFDDLRKERKVERIAILAHGLSGWIAMRYATKYPKNVSHLILISTWSNGKAWGDGRTRTEQDGKNRKDLEQEHFAQMCIVDIQTGKPNYSPTSEAEGQALLRMSWTTYFADPRDFFLAYHWPEVRREMGGVLIPMDFDAAKEKGNPVPTLLLCGASPRALWTSVDDMRQLNKYYSSSELVTFTGSNRMPMIEEHATFTKAVKGFLKKHPFKKGKAK